jgi:lactoylglutathione lyase
MTGVLVHVGLTTRDMDRSRRFYTDALGFVFDRDLHMTGDQVDGLLRLDQKSDLHAVYLRLGAFTLELMQFDPAADAGAGVRRLSIAVADMPATLGRVVAAGGVVVSHIGRACIVRDPDGQLIELLEIAVHDEIEARRRG